jgi:hypothetical protein
MEALDRRALIVFNRLRPMFLFKGLSDADLVELTRKLERVTPDPAKPILEEGAEPSETAGLYIVDKGRVKLTYSAHPRTQTLEPGDFFGGEIFLSQTTYTFSFSPQGEVGLLHLKREDTEALLIAHPAVRVALSLINTTRRWLYSRAWEWIAPNENVYLIAQRHVAVLWQRQIWPVVVGVAALGAATALAFFNLLMPGLWLGGILLVAALAWAYFVYVDWGNDFYVVTNQRVAYVEKIILLYDSRQTVSMNALNSVQTGSGNVADRFLEYGDITVNTFAQPLLVRAVAFPQLVGALVDEQIARAKTRTREFEVNTLKSAIRDRIAPPLPKPKEDPTAVPIKAAAKPQQTSSAPALATQLRNYFSFQLRFDQGDSIIYRKHWWILLNDIGWPSAAMLFTAGVIGVLLTGPMQREGWALNPPAIVLVLLLVFIGLAGWWLYEFEDWRNDLYMVTPDQIVDIYKKPLGQEIRDSSTLDKIQGLRSERTGIIGRLFNFGNVTANVPGKVFTFDGVYDPLSVQEDVQRRIEAFKSRQGRAEALRRREELADVLSAYYLATREMNPDQKPGV